MALEPGARVGPYEIQQWLGAGGMGEVYKAFDTRLDRPVALKILPPDKVADPHHKQRFLLEAKAASALNHPNIVTIYDVGTCDGIEYLAMEFVQGNTLDEVIPRHGMRFSDLLNTAIQAADALARAHEAGIIHRDLKPTNVMVTENGSVKLLDFGLAKLAAVAAAADNRTDTHTMELTTGEGPVMGTTAYMSPEQTEGRAVDARSDIFSFGAVLYEMATGRRAFQGDSRIGTLSSILRDDPTPATELRHDLPAEMGRVLTRCLRKDPARRFQHMDDLKVALQELKEEAENPSAPAAKGVAAAAAAEYEGGLPPWTWVAAVGLLLVGGIAGWRFSVWRAGRNALMQPVPLTSYQGNEYTPTFSPDGNQLAFAWSGDKQDNFDIYIKLVGPGAPLRLTTDPAPDREPKWSPDGRSIAFVRWVDRNQVAIMTVPSLGGAERRVASFATTRAYGSNSLTSLCWTPDSKHLVVSAAPSANQPNNLFLVSLDTGQSRGFTHPPQGTDGDARPAVSPDGHWVAFLRYAGLNIATLDMQELSDTLDPIGEPKTTPMHGVTASRATWTNDGREILFASGEGAGSYLYRMAAMRPGEPRLLAGIGVGAGMPAISPQGHRMAFTVFEEDSNIWRVELDGKSAPEQFLSSTFREVFPQYSPDGKRLAFYSNRTGSLQIWVCNADGSQAVPLTSLSGPNTGSPRWSPDGQQISFDSNSGGNWQIYTIGADGGQPRQLTNDSSTNVVASWSHDGKFIYFASKRSGDYEVWRMPSQGGQATQITHHGGSAPQESPDGRMLYFTKGDGSGVWKTPVEGGSEAQVVPGVFRYNYALTPQGMYYMTPPGADRMAAVNYLDFATGQTRVVTKIEKPADLGLAVSPDGKYVLFTQVDYERSDVMLVENFH